MRRCSVAEGVHQEAELFLGFFGGEAQVAEHHHLRFPVVDTDGAAADFIAVEHDVVRVGPYGAGVGLQQGDVLPFGRSEGMVHGVVALRLFVPFEQGEVHYPERSENVRVAQSQARGQFHAQGAERFAGAVGSAGHNEDQVAGMGAHLLGNGLEVLRRVELVYRRFEGAVRVVLDVH